MEKQAQASERRRKHRERLRENGLVEIKPRMAPYWIIGIDRLMEASPYKLNRSDVVRKMLNVFWDTESAVLPDDRYPWVNFCPRNKRKQITIVLPKTMVAWLKANSEYSIDERLEAALMHWIETPDGKPVIDGVLDGVSVPLPEFEWLATPSEHWQTTHAFRVEARAQARERQRRQFLKHLYLQGRKQ